MHMEPFTVCHTKRDLSIQSNKIAERRIKKNRTIDEQQEASISIAKYTFLIV